MDYLRFMGRCKSMGLDLKCCMERWIESKGEVRMREVAAACSGG